MDLVKNNVAIVDNKEYEIPEGIEPISDDGLYSVKWDLIEIADELSDDKDLKFFNPRHLGQYEIKHDDGNVEVFLGQGFDKASMVELMQDITNKGLEIPLICRWIHKGQVKPQVNDGERRWRCIDRLREKNEKVYDPRDGNFRSAREVYDKIICRIRPMTDEEALQRAAAVTDMAVKWGDAALARYVKTLYERGFSDEKVCALLNKGPQWVAETNRLNELDDFSFNFLLSGQINRKVALDLVKITDVARRKEWLTDAWQRAVTKHKQEQEKLEVQVEKAEANAILATAELEEAKLNNEAPEVVQELEQGVVEAETKVAQRKKAKAASARPLIKSKQMREAAGGVFKNALRAPKIERQLKVVKDLIDGNTTDFNMQALKTVAACYEAILEGNDDIMSVLKSVAV